METDQPLRLYTCTVEPGWIDYNEHMTEASYLTAFGWASDALFRLVGIDDAYRTEGYSFYTVETHINYYQEAKLGELLHFTTQVLDLDEKRLHFFHTMHHSNTDNLLATTEQMLVHVDMNAAVAAPIKPKVYQALQTIFDAHKNLPIPAQVGRQMVIKRP